MKRRTGSSQPDTRPPEELARAILNHPYDGTTFGECLRQPETDPGLDQEGMATARAQSALADALEAIAKKRDITPLNRSALENALVVIRNFKALEMLERREFDRISRGLSGIFGQAPDDVGETTEPTPKQELTDKDRGTIRDQAQDAAVNLHQIATIEKMMRSLANKLGIRLNAPPQIGFLGL